MNHTNPIRHDLSALAHALENDRPACPLARIESEGGKLFLELADSGAAPYDSQLCKLIGDGRRPPGDIFIQAVQEWVPLLRPGWEFVGRVMSVGDRATYASAMRTVAAHISTDDDLAFVAKVWADLPDATKDRIVQQAQESVK